MSARPPTGQIAAPLSAEVRRALMRSFDIRWLRLTETRNGYVLEGCVACYRSKKLAAEEATRLLGTTRVVNRLRVVPEEHRCDDELAAAVQSALRKCRSLSKEQIIVTSRRGVVGLQGTVATPPLRCAAEAAVWAIGGVLDVQNGLVLRNGSAKSNGYM